MEFALILPLVLIIGAGAINIGMWMWQIVMVIEGNRGSGRASAFAVEVTPLLNPGQSLSCDQMKTAVANFNSDFGEGANLRERNWSPVSNSAAVKAANWGNIAGRDRNYTFLAINRQTNSSTSCLFCYGGIWSSLNTSFESLFLLVNVDCPIT